MGVSKDLIYHVDTLINLPKSDVLQFFTDDGTIATVRPSGTEPKIKFYLSMRGLFDEISEFEETEQEIDNKLEKLAAEFTKMAGLEED